MKESYYPECIHVAKKVFDEIGEDDYYDDVLVWAGLSEKESDVSYVRSDLAPRWRTDIDQCPYAKFMLFKFTFCGNTCYDIGYLGKSGYEDGAVLLFAQGISLDIEYVQAWMDYRTNEKNK